MFVLIATTIILSLMLILMLYTAIKNRDMIFLLGISFYVVGAFIGMYITWLILLSLIHSAG